MVRKFSYFQSRALLEITQLTKPHFVMKAPRLVALPATSNCALPAADRPCARPQLGKAGLNLTRHGHRHRFEDAQETASGCPVSPMRNWFSSPKGVAGKTRCALGSDPPDPCVWCATWATSRLLGMHINSKRALWLTAKSKTVDWSSVWVGSSPTRFGTCCRTIH